MEDLRAGGCRDWFYSFVCISIIASVISQIRSGDLNFDKLTIYGNEVTLNSAWEKILKANKFKMSSSA